MLLVVFYHEVMSSILLKAALYNFLMGGISTI